MRESVIFVVGFDSQNVRDVVNLKVLIENGILDTGDEPFSHGQRPHLETLVKYPTAAQVARSPTPPNPETLYDPFADGKIDDKRIRFRGVGRNRDRLSEKHLDPPILVARPFVRHRKRKAHIHSQLLVCET